MDNFTSVLDCVNIIVAFSFFPSFFFFASLTPQVWSFTLNYIYRGGATPCYLGDNKTITTLLLCSYFAFWLFS